MLSAGIWKTGGIMLALMRVSLAAVLALLATGAADAASVPYSLDGTWVCTFKDKTQSKIEARSGKPGVTYEYNGNGGKLWINNTDDGGISAHADTWSWTLTPKAGAAELHFQNPAKNQDYTVPCVKQ